MFSVFNLQQGGTNSTLVFGLFILVRSPLLFDGTFDITSDKE